MVEKGFLVSLADADNVTKGITYPIIQIEDLTFYARRYYYFDDNQELSWAYKGTPYFTVYLYEEV